MKKKSYMIILFIYFILGACTNNGDTNFIVSFSSMPFNSFVTVNFYVSTTEDVNNLGVHKSKKNTPIESLEDAYEERFRVDFMTYFNKMHMLYDNFYNYEGTTNLKTINDNYAQEEEVIIDNVLFDTLQKAIEFTISSKGKFNISIGLLSELWNQYINGLGLVELPTSEQIEEAKKCIIPYNELTDYIILDEQKNSVKFLNYPTCNQKVQLTLGGYAKGKAIEDYYEKYLLDFPGYGFFNGGTSSLKMFSEQPFNQNGWKIEIKNAHNPYDDAIATITKQAKFSISTSGDYVNFLEENNQRYHHIIDPFSGYPSNYFNSITLISENAGLADMISTSLMMTSVENLQAEIAIYEEIYQTKIFVIAQKNEGNQNKIYISSDFLDNVTFTNTKQIYETI